MTVYLGCYDSGMSSGFEYTVIKVFRSLRQAEEWSKLDRQFYIEMTVEEEEPAE